MVNIINRKNLILEATKSGFLFFKHIIPELTISSNGTSCKSVRNPFYNDKNPSLSIYFWNDRWWFKDFGDESYSGDIFEFAAYFFVPAGSPKGPCIVDDK